MLSASKSGSGLATGYNLTRSLRFRASASGYLNRTPSVAGNRQTWTYSVWAKLGAAVGTSNYNILMARTSASYYTGIYFNANNLYLDWYNSSQIALVRSSQVFRDPSAWYHIVIAVNTTSATSSNRILMYVNGTQVTAFTTATYPPQNAQTAGINEASIATWISSDPAYPAQGYYDGYLAEVNFIDGQALTPSSFGSTNSLTGVWQPARYTGSYGTNGFYLPFTDNSALTTSSNVGLGKDFSGNGNYWTTNNISITAGVTYDSMTDVPTLTSATAANFCVMNPLDKGSNVTISNGNLTLAHGASSPDAIRATFGLPSTGQWYWEVTVTAIGSGGNIGVATQSSSLFPATPFTGVLSQYTGYYSINSWSNNGSYTSWTTGDVIAVAVNTGTGAITFYKNGTSLGAIPTTLSSSSVYFPFIQGNNCTFNVNFGQRPFAYTPPTGFVALNTYNLPTSTILQGNTVMDATIYTGAGGTQSITNAAGFKPDFVWAKSRSNAFDHALYDSVRGAGTAKYLISNATSAEGNYSNSYGSLSSFNSNGFTVAAGTDPSFPSAFFNQSGATYVAWQWQAGQGSSSSNTSGSITSTVSVNASAGFSVVTYTGTAVAATVGHGLGVAPSWIVVKGRTNVSDWRVYHSSVTLPNVLNLNTTSAAASDAGAFGSTAPTSSVFTLGTGSGTNGSANTYVAYCWTPIAGFSAFGSYTGNASTDGTFVYLGFRPKFVMIKRTDSTSDWYIWDTARDTYNVVTNTLLADTSGAETSATSIDDLSNGFKCRSATVVNASGGTYIYAAFAENPFKNSLAR